MDGQILKLSKEGALDESFMLLLTANINQAMAAGATDAGNMLTKLKEKAELEKDKAQTAPEIRLLRRLLREPDSIKREQILEDAFTPKEKLLVAGSMENAEKALTGEAPDEEKVRCRACAHALRIAQHSLFHFIPFEFGH